MLRCHRRACSWLPSKANAETDLPIATFPFPSVSNIIHDVILAKGFDRANGLRAKPIVYGNGGALWAGLAKGEIPMHNMSPFQLQKMRADGVPHRDDRNAAAHERLAGRYEKS